MPLFEYRCPSCGALFEKLVSIDQRDDVRCPACDAPHVERRPSTFAAQTSGGSSEAPPLPCGKPHGSCSCCNN